MSVQPSSDVKLEIGHVLFIDIVGYSKLLINEQSEQMQKSKEIVRGTQQFRLVEAEGKLLRLPTGDGGALVFRTNVEAPVLCALEISKELKKHPELRVRMRIHSGPVNEITDLNEQANIAGAGINIAQRVMDCGDADHILLSRHVAEDLEQYPRWRAYLHDLGECEVKHGVRVGVVNLSGDGAGNAAAPKKFHALKRHRAHVRWAEAAIALLVVAAVISAFIYVLRRGPARSLANVMEKSIAVLPLVSARIPEFDSLVGETVGFMIGYLNPDQGRLGGNLQEVLTKFSHHPAIGTRTATRATNTSHIAYYKNAQAVIRPEMLVLLPIFRKLAFLLH